jgi:anthranilate phosphoribosyltransferase
VELGTDHAFVVHGAGQLDEISIAGPTIVAEVRAGSVQKFHVAPEDFGKKPAPLAAIQGGNPTENAALLRDLLGGVLESEADRVRRDIVAINASAALVAAGVAGNFREGAELAEQALGDGKAKDKLEALRRYGEA